MANSKLPIDAEAAAKVRKMGDLLNECRRYIEYGTAAGYNMSALDQGEQAMRARLQVLLEKFPIRTRRE